MPASYSIADARHNLAAIEHELDHEPAIRLTRRGQPVAVLLSMSEYARMQSGAVRSRALMLPFAQRSIWLLSTSIRSYLPLPVTTPVAAR